MEADRSYQRCDKAYTPLRTRASVEYVCSTTAWKILEATVNTVNFDLECSDAAVEFLVRCRVKSM